ncbi:4-hydroxybenzoate octaprenyltransferase [Sphingomonas sp. UV9]|uniref:4-hydroxybenzoate octaprenyltransferase n=1 Tax=Sphingomonas sp. UV9 TaxID=1851410 RepID=UPI000FFBABD9|nr:4-hydroxybenzoate octaprenyltransferase [Sphingomonas sp. UV9]RXD05137.1 4-hydroxybenzoate octaprenyltransferase [Sphingomonas sp. UV9]
MQTKPSPAEIVPDSEHRGLVGRLPPTLRGLALLARFDRPIGWWLLFWPGAWGVALAGGAVQRWDLILWLLLGSIAMRGAGCVFNDIVDRDLDAQVARTRARPIPSGLVSIRLAWVWLVVLCLIGFVVLLQLRFLAAIVALASLAPVAAYPFMKRITWWPQAWLGIVFSWALLVGWSHIAGTLDTPMWLLYAGSIAWVIGYDTIYALQDREDDAMIGIRSSALRMGTHVKAGVGIFYVAAVAFWAAAVWTVRPDPLAIAALVPVALHLAWQVATLRPGTSPEAGTAALARFRANRFAGLLMFLACVVVGTSLDP